MAYYYAVAALPMLNFPEKPHISSSEFIDFCREQLSEKHFAILEKAVITNLEQEKEKGKSLFECWQKWEIALRNELVRLRAEMKKQEPGEYLREAAEVIGMGDLAKNAFSGTDPLDSEKKLYQARWNYLEELGTNIFFTVETLLIYYLKLQILENMQKFEEEAGRTNFNEIYKVIRDGADRTDNTEIESDIGVNP